MFSDFLSTYVTRSLLAKSCTMFVQPDADVIKAYHLHSNRPPAYLDRRYGGLRGPSGQIGKVGQAESRWQVYGP